LEITDKNAVIKSGSDFKNLTLNKIKIYKNLSEEFKQEINNKRYISDKKEKCFLFFEKKDYYFSIDNELFYITKDLEEDLEVRKIVNEFQEVIKEEFKTKIGNIYKPINAKFDIVRSTCSSIGNFICDVTRIFSNTDICLINSGTLRIDGMIEQGILT
jgi:hypothetical protein